MPPFLLLATLAVALVLGGVTGYFLRYFHALSRRRSIELETKERILEAEERAIKIIEKAEAKADSIEHDAKAEIKTKTDDLNRKEERLLKREELIDARQIDLESEKEAVRAKIEEVKSIKVRLDDHAAELDRKLEEIAGLSAKEAAERLMKRIETEREADLVERIKKVQLQGDEQFEGRAMSILLTAMQRVGNSMPTSFLTAHVEIPSDDMKGKVIGKEGRNVRAFERATGVDVLIDETPGFVVLSSFDPIRREIARVALETLMKDGRIQPARIEEVVEKARAEVAAHIKKAGERATYEANVPNLHPDLITILGRLYFRTSYGQNVLAHSIEVANIAAMIAEEVGANVPIARAGGLLHDIGKTVSHEVQGSHVDIGIRILEKYGVSNEVILAMRSHHDEYPYETPESVIVQIADSLSGSRPGARRDSIENYIKRLTDLENIATTLEGVDRAFAIAAGREIRVLVNPEELNEFQSNDLARTIATNIEAQLRYPGEIKVHVIRETRVVSYAR